MTTITINTYDAASRFDMNNEEAAKFFEYVAAQAEDTGYQIKHTQAVQVDADSEDFITSCFENY